MYNQPKQLRKYSLGKVCSAVLFPCLGMLTERDLTPAFRLYFNV